MAKVFSIYLHQNKNDKKVYIGQTCQQLEKRWHTKGEGYRRHPRFYAAIQADGWDNFEHIVLEEGLTQEEANEKERFYIQLYDATNPEYGYNMLPGGSNVAGENNPMFGRHHTEETKELISLKAKNRSEETHKRMSESAKRRVERDGAPFLGKHLSEEAKNKLRQVDKSYMKTAEYRAKMSEATSGAKNGAAKKVKAFNPSSKEELKFGCKSDALKYLGLSRSSSKFLNKAIKEKTIYHNFYWEEE